jgi:hypothetical protein
VFSALEGVAMVLSNSLCILPSLKTEIGGRHQKAMSKTIGQMLDLLLGAAAPFHAELLSAAVERS